MHRFLTLLVFSLGTSGTLPQTREFATVLLRLSWDVPEWNVQQVVFLLWRFFSSHLFILTAESQLHCSAPGWILFSWGWIRALVSFVLGEISPGLRWLLWLVFLPNSPVTQELGCRHLLQGFLNLLPWLYHQPKGCWFPTYCQTPTLSFQFALLSVKEDIGSLARERSHVTGGYLRASIIPLFFSPSFYISEVMSIETTQSGIDQHSLE